MDLFVKKKIKCIFHFAIEHYNTVAIGKVLLGFKAALRDFGPKECRSG